MEGDSGGPLLIPHNSKKIKAGDPELDMIVGITSMGFDDCHDPAPSIYTSIGAFWDWIQETIGEGPEVNCSPNLFFCPDRFVQVPEPSEEPSPSVPPFPKVDEPADGKLKEKLEQQELDEECERLKEFSDTELLNVTSMMNQISLYICKWSHRKQLTL